MPRFSLQSNNCVLFFITKPIILRHQDLDFMLFPYCFEYYFFFFCNICLKTQHWHSLLYSKIGWELTLHQEGQGTAHHKGAAFGVPSKGRIRRVASQPMSVEPKSHHNRWRPGDPPHPMNLQRTPGSHQRYREQKECKCWTNARTTKCQAQAEPKLTTRIRFTFIWFEGTEYGLRRGTKQSPTLVSQPEAQGPPPPLTGRPPCSPVSGPAQRAAHSTQARAYFSFIYTSHEGPLD